MFNICILVCELTDEAAEQRGVETQQLEPEQHGDEARKQSGGDGGHVVNKDRVDRRSVGQTPDDEPSQRVEDTEHRQYQTGLGARHLDLNDRLLVDVHERREHTYSAPATTTLTCTGVPRETTLGRMSPQDSH